MYVLYGTVQLVLVDCYTVCLGRLQITRCGRSASIPGGRRAQTLSQTSCLRHSRCLSQLLSSLSLSLSLCFSSLLVLWWSWSVFWWWGKGGYAHHTNLWSPAHGAPLSHDAGTVSLCPFFPDDHCANSSPNQLLESRLSNNHILFWSQICFASCTNTFRRIFFCAH